MKRIEHASPDLCSKYIKPRTVSYRNPCHITPTGILPCFCSTLLSRTPTSLALHGHRLGVHPVVTGRPVRHQSVPPRRTTRERPAAAEEFILDLCDGRLFSETVPRRERGRSKRCPCERGGLRGAFASGGVAVKTPEASKKGLAVGLASAFGGRFGTVVVGCHQQMGILLLLSHSKFWAGW